MPDPRSMTLHGHRLSYTDTRPDHDACPDAATAPPPATTILFVHGLMSSSQTWSDQTGRLHGRRVIAPDLFGHGESAKPPGDYSLGAHAATLRDLMDELEVRTVTVVGHSLGGGVALQFAYLFPDRVDAVVLVSSGGLGKEVNPLLRAATLPGSELVLPLVASSWLHGVGDTALRYWGKLGLPPISPSSDEAWRNLSTLADGPTRTAFLATSRSVINVGGQTVAARDRLPGLRSRPSLVIWGARDRIVPSSHLENARTELPDAQVEIFDRAGHFPHLDEPDRFATVLNGFLDGSVRTSGSPAGGPAAATPTRHRAGR
ncbi:alpha/beta fold hydrolase [Nakamurella sp. GG22]